LLRRAGGSARPTREWASSRGVRGRARGAQPALDWSGAPSSSREYPWRGGDRLGVARGKRPEDLYSGHKAVGEGCFLMRQGSKVAAWDACTGGVRGRVRRRREWRTTRRGKHAWRTESGEDTTVERRPTLLRSPRGARGTSASVPGPRRGSTMAAHGVAGRRRAVGSRAPSAC
jgi:hypothetical protein